MYSESNEAFLKPRKMKTTELKTDTGEINQTTSIDNSSMCKDFNYTVKSNTGQLKKIDIQNYTTDGNPIFEINGVTIFGEHLRLLKEFLNQ